ncbi:c-type cytochrome [Terrimonas pollutisoli]|uniref:c-type cytochrome n=1 Tax=Terrimonas pollutisoli TaxID=3034147 RepID=UPI0023EAA9F4|nr:cytochrome c [Terrimonas sp. H1YJ31]
MIKLVSIILTLPCIFIIGSSFFQSDELAKSIERGKEVYASYCMSCHMEDGKGTPDINPPLAKADYIRSPSKNLIRIILEGQSGEIVVNKKKYNTPMLPFSYLSDEQVADVLNYVRNSWGNKVAGIIKPAQVKALRN